MVIYCFLGSEISDVNLIEPLVNDFVIKIGDERKSSGGKNDGRKPPSGKNDGTNKSSAGINLPKIIKVVRKEITLGMKENLTNTLV